MAPATQPKPTTTAESSHVDAAIRGAIKAAVDAGDFERAAELLAVLRRAAAS